MTNLSPLIKFCNLHSIFCQQDYSLKDKNTYHTGGLARLAVFPHSIESARAVLAQIEQSKINYAVLGGGSNLLVSDDGFDGVVICVDKLKGINVCGNLLTAYAGEKVSSFLKACLMSSLGGVEFLNGIPATVGGVVAMNAGCFGKNVGDYVSYVVSASGIYAYKDCGFDYRTSRFKQDKDMILAVCFNLENVEYDQSENKAEYFLKLRKNKQPKGRSCGSVFKNDGYQAGKVIESCALKGFRMGTCKVSEKHANFILADANAKSSDIKRLIAHVKKTVKEKCGILLQEELEYLGRFEDEDKF